MTEINPDLELLVMRSESAASGVTKARSAGAMEDGDILHRYGSNVEIRRAQPTGTGGTPAIEAHDVPGTLTLAERLGVEAFTLRRSPDYRVAKANRPRDGEEWSMRGCAPVPGDTPAREALVTTMVAGDDDGAPAAPAPGAAMLIGSVAVGIIIVNGPTAATQFTDAERVKVVAEIQAGLTWLGNQEPSAGVSWNYEINSVSITTATDAQPPMTSRAGETRPWGNSAIHRIGRASLTM